MLREETKIPLGALQRPARTAGFDNKRILVAKVKRRRPEGVRVREATHSLRENAIEGVRNTLQLAEETQRNTRQCLLLAASVIPGH